jgi:hypothetical protein
MVAGGSGRRTQLLGVVHGLGGVRTTETRSEMRREAAVPQLLLLTVARTS